MYLPRWTYFLFLLALTVFARRAWEPEDVMPLYSIRSAVGIEITEYHLYIAVPEGIVGFERFGTSIDYNSWQTFSIPHGVRGLMSLGDTIYVITSSGVYSRRENAFYDEPFRVSSSFPRFPPNITGSLLQDEIYSLPPGLYWGNGDTIWDCHLQEFHVTDAANDGQGNIYFTTDGLGVFRIDQRIGIAEPIAFGPCCNSVLAMAKLGDTLFFGGCEEILTCAFAILDRRHETCRWAGGEYGVAFPAYGIVEDIELYDDMVYLATRNGLALYDMDNRNWLRPTGKGSLPLTDARGLAILRDTLYVAAEDGIYFASLDDRKLRKATVAGEGRFVDIDTALGTVYATGDFGAMKREDSTFVVYNPPDGMLTNFVRCISYSTEDEAVFGSNAGVLIVDKYGGRSRLPANIWFDSNAPNDIVATKRYLWVATDKGLYMYNRRYKTVMHLGEKYYFPETAIYRLLLDGNWLWLMTDRGVYRFFWNEPTRPGF